MRLFQSSSNLSARNFAGFSKSLFADSTIFGSGFEKGCAGDRERDRSKDCLMVNR